MTELQGLRFHKNNKDYREAQPTPYSQIDMALKWTWPLPQRPIRYGTGPGAAAPLHYYTIGLLFLSFEGGLGGNPSKSIEVTNF